MRRFYGGCILVMFFVLLCSCQRTQLVEEKKDTTTNEIENHFEEKLDNEQNHEELKETVSGNDTVTVENGRNEEFKNEEIDIDSAQDLKIDFDMVEIEGLKYGISSVGGKVLEDGITFLLAVYNEDDDVAWVKSWNGIEVTELMYYSGIEVSGNEIYIVVNYTLYVIDIENGNILWETPNVSSPEHAPIIDVDGSIYLVSERKPYLIKISSDGTVMWRLNSDKLYGIYDLNFDDDEMTAKFTIVSVESWL